MPGLLIDIEPLRRYPQFRRLWFGYLLRQLGAQLTVTTVIYQVFRLTNSNLDVGLLSLAQLGPAVLAPMVGGAVADAIDRRKLLLITAVLIATCTVGLALNTESGHPALWLIFVLSAASWGFAGIDAPTRTAVTFAIVGRESIVSANVLRQLLGQIANMAGPGIAGPLIFLFAHHLAVVYWIDVASTVGALQALFRLPPMHPSGGGTKFSLGSIAEGFRHIRGRQVLQGVFLADLDATILGQPTSLFPYMAFVRFHGGPGVFGLLSAAPAIGAFFGSIVSGWTRTIRRQGFAVIVAVSVWGLAIAVFGFAPWLWLGVTAVAIAGWADATSALFRTTILMFEIPDRLRGRLSSIQSIVVQSGPRLGNTEGGLMAAATSAPIAIWSGGLACILGALVMARLMPEFTGYDVRKAPGWKDQLNEVGAEGPSG